MNLPSYRSPRVSSEIPDCSKPLTFDTYNMCTFSCRYCFGISLKENNPILKNVKLQGVDYVKFIKAITGEPQGQFWKEFHTHFFKRRFLLHWGGLTDPFCKLEKQYGHGYPIMEALGQYNYPCLFSFKGRTIFEDKYAKLFDNYKKQKNFAFQISIVSPSDEISKRLECGAPSTSRRIEAIKLLSDMGYWTILRLRPFIIGITDEGLEELLHRAYEAGAKAISTEFFAVDKRITESMHKRFKIIGKMTGVNDMCKYFKDLSPPKRGGYQRLNRIVKEKYIKIIYKFCLEHDMLFACSDPDFKELNMSGSCCGMPEAYPDNPSMCNWTKNQLTYHLKQARKIYHRRGRLYTFYFNKVYKDESYLHSNYLAIENIGVVGKSYAQRVKITQLLMLQDKWNNLNSPANPSSYFHDKMRPTGLTDDGGNYIYVYNPMEYEKRWVDEGINLTK